MAVGFYHYGGLAIFEAETVTSRGEYGVEIVEESTSENQPLYVEHATPYCISKSHKPNAVVILPQGTPGL